MSEYASHAQPSIDIIVASDTLSLKGAGQDVNPALLSGNVVLYLNEPTSLKHITLQFRGKAKLPASQAESIPMQSTQLTYLVCNHEWSFLEGVKGHSHTLKAGRHLFPFQLHLGGSLPSSVQTTALGGASISYKLRATAARSGFSFSHRDIHAECPIYLMRSLAAESLEFQQTLEIENTWPEKLMYSIMIPHKAWAAGDRVTAVVKFSPLVKGARVRSVTTTVNEGVKIYGRTIVTESSRVIASVRHDIVDGQAIPHDERLNRYRLPLASASTSSSGLRSAYPSPPTSASSSSQPGTLYFPQYAASQHSSSSDLAPLSASSSVDGSTSSLPVAGPSSPTNGSSSTGAASPGVRIVNGVEIPLEPGEEASQDVVTTLHITIPENATASHALEPLVVSHRIRWSIMIGNRDGHTSELRCSLPFMILDHKLLDEARAATLATRRLVLGPSDIEGGQAVGTHGENADFDAEDDMELPSYPAHVRDRVANVFMPETGVLRVTNPWVAQGVSPVMPWSEASSGLQSPVETLPVVGHTSPRPRSQLPSNPSNGNTELDWVNSELLLSLTQHPETPHAVLESNRSRRSNQQHTRSPPSESDVASPSGPNSLFGSRRGSRTNSRAPSPDRNTNGNGTHTPSETYVHHSNTASRHSHGLFHISMKPFASLTNGFGLGSRTASHSNLQNHLPHGHSNLAHSTGADTAHSRSESGTTASQPNVAPMSTTARPITLEPVSGPMLLHRAFTETPDYEMASRGFLGGGVPPLDVMRGLPSYEDAAAEGRGERSGELERRGSEGRREPRRTQTAPAGITV
ncbi:hypothetical protein BXZ70DRAFT_1069158 [Cristinia sonorae]|uniref:Arrestin C-terminal-like domain-containing protein n=1 Tax=Cristinia sonorae TaxID=1940300 RepID=A0A8K0UZK9_9AGAR|nr:hypothetical protein BXZ70DRAFT_1069158 [Cristinia sonorae]